jgi:hypothetical protein
MGQMPHQSMVLKNTLYFRLETTSSTQFSQSAFYAVLLLSKVETTELYYITVGGAPISLQSNLVPGAIVDNDGSGYEIVSVKLSSVKQVKPKTWRIFTFAEARTMRQNDATGPKSSW